MGGWKWKAEDGSTSGLLYEPGNWGDILKNEWLLLLLCYLQAKHGDASLNMLDPFAGMPRYPLADSTRKRLEMLPGFLLAASLDFFFHEDCWPCASLLAGEYCGQSFHADVFDADDLRREGLGREDGLTLLDAECGWSLLQENTCHYSLVLVDPYDILQNWRQWLPGVLKQAKCSPVLVYVYNRSGRGKERLRDYRAFCAEVRRSGFAACLARVASDAFLPDCWHEMLLLAPQACRNSAGWDNLLSDLRESAETITQAINKTGIFEIF